MLNLLLHHLLVNSLLKAVVHLLISKSGSAHKEVFSKSFPQYFAEVFKSTTIL
jgi:hypothetical protein